MIRARARVLLPAVLSLALACGHGDTFTTPPTGTDQPFLPGTPTRLTYNPLLDSEIAWSADGSALVYTATRGDAPNLSRCIELLPPGGGRDLRSLCPSSLIEDSTVAFESGAVSDSGQVVFLRSAKSPLNSGWVRRSFVLTSLGSTQFRELQSLPFAGSFQPHGGASQLRWLGEGRFVYLAEDYQVAFCPTCAPHDSAIGLFIVIADLGSDPAVFTEVPGTSGASGVAVDGPDAIVYTLAGDAHVYRQVLSSGVVTPLWDFGVGNTVQWAQSAGNRLAALVDGAIWVVDLAAATATPLTVPTWESLALSPDGLRLVALQQRDLWLFDLP